jgi:DNA-binding MarR family transcriptional regulator
MATHASMRKRILMEIYHRSSGDMSCSINCAELARDLGLQVEDLIAIVYQLEGKDWVIFTVKSLDADRTNWLIVMTMRGIEEAEKLERNWLRRLYEDHFALVGSLWTIIVLILSVVLNRLADLLLKAIDWL